MQPLSNVSEKRRGLALEGQESFQMSQESPLRPAMGEYIAPPSKSNRYVQICAIADCPPHKNRTVRPSNATARTTLNACQKRPLCPWLTVRPSGADCPQFKVSKHTELSQVCRFQMLGRRTVRSPGPDRPPDKISPTTETSKFLDQQQKS